MPFFQGIWRRKYAGYALVLILLFLAGGWFVFGRVWWNDAALGRELTALQNQPDYGDRATRIMELRDSLRQDSANAELLISLGNNWKQIADFTQKQEHFQHALDAYARAYQSSGEKNSLALANQGIIYVLLRDYVKAEQTYRLAVEKNPGEPDYYVRLVEVLRFAQSSHESIIEVYRLGLDQLVDNALLVQSLAEYLFDIGRYTDALTYYKILATKYEGFDERIKEIEQKISTGAVPVTP